MPKDLQTASGRPVEPGGKRRFFYCGGVGPVRAGASDVCELRQQGVVFFVRQRLRGGLRAIRLRPAFDSGREFPEGEVVDLAGREAYYGSAAVEAGEAELGSGEGLNGASP